MIQLLKQLQDEVRVQNKVICKQAQTNQGLKTQSKQVLVQIDQTVRMLQQQSIRTQQSWIEGQQKLLDYLFALGLEKKGNKNQDKADRDKGH